MSIKSKLLDILIKTTRQNLVLPFYHAVSDHELPHLSRLYKVSSVKQFKNDMDELLTHYQPLRVDDLIKSTLGGKKLNNPSFMLTFDDGLRVFKEYAWPVLKQMGVPVVLFVNPDFVDNKALFYRFKANLLYEHLYNNALPENKKRQLKEIFEPAFSNKKDLSTHLMQVNYHQQALLDEAATILNLDFKEYLQKIRPYLTLNELHDLSSQGVYIGAHSMDHPLFNQLDFNEMVNQVKGSTDWVRENFDQTYSLFSFPFTDYGLSTGLFNAIRAGKLADLTFGTAGIKKERIRTHWQRIPVEDSTQSLRMILLRQYLYYLAKAPFFKNTIRR